MLKEFNKTTKPVGCALGLKHRKILLIVSLTNMLISVLRGESCNIDIDPNFRLINVRCTGANLRVSHLVVITTILLQPRTSKKKIFMPVLWHDQSIYLSLSIIDH